MQSVSNLNDYVGNGGSVARGQHHLGSMDIESTQNLGGYAKSGYNSYEQLIQLSNGGYFQECLTPHHNQSRPAVGRHLLGDKDSYENNNELTPAIQ